eukprot:1476149-Rhodomonas_salina.11
MCSAAFLSKLRVSSAGSCNACFGARADVCVGGGDQINVTEANRKEYVELYVRYLLQYALCVCPMRNAYLLRVCATRTMLAEPVVTRVYGGTQDSITQQFSAFADGFHQVP